MQRLILYQSKKLADFETVLELRLTPGPTPVEERGAMVDYQLSGSSM
jgi:hypothetical protein